MSVFNKAIDQLLNRLGGAYKGYLTPRIPKQFTIPVIEEVVRDLDNIPDFIGRRLRRSFPDLRFNHALVIVDPVTRDVAGERVARDLSDVGTQVDLQTIRSNRIEEVNAITQACVTLLAGLETSSKVELTALDAKYGRIKCGKKKHDIVYGIGGGTVIDVAKYIAYKLNLPFVSIPTSLANDGFASPFSVLNLGDDGVATLTANTPVAVVVDISLIMSDDSGYQRRVRSGIGDLLSNLTAVLDWRLASKTGHDQFESAPAHQSACAARCLLDRILREDHYFDNMAFLDNLACSLVASAAAMNRCGSSKPASGFEHKLYHAYNKLMDFRPAATHGELVAIGALISSHRHAKYHDELKRAFKRVGLPCSHEDLAAVGITRDNLDKAIEMAVNIKPDRHTILEQEGVEALKESAAATYFSAPHA